MHMHTLTAYPDRNTYLAALLSPANPSGRAVLGFRTSLRQAARESLHVTLVMGACPHADGKDI